MAIKEVIPMYHDLGNAPENSGIEDRFARRPGGSTGRNAEEFIDVRDVGLIQWQRWSREPRFAAEARARRCDGGLRPDCRQISLHSMVIR